MEQNSKTDVSSGRNRPDRSQFAFWNQDTPVRTGLFHEEMQLRRRLLNYSALLAAALPRYYLSFNHLSTRADTNPALFVSLSKPNNRLTISGVEVRLRTIGKSIGMDKIHPHKFRRTLATMAIDKGMPIEQVQCILGHVKIDTTLHYAKVNQANVKMSHRKYIG